MRLDLWLRRVSLRIGRLDAELILAEVLGVERVWLHGHGEWELADSEVAGADEMVGRRVEGEPLAYILGWREFLGRRFGVDRRVLVPRPETEGLVEVALGYLDVQRETGLIEAQYCGEVPMKCLDVQCGTDSVEVLSLKSQRLTYGMCGTHIDGRPKRVLDVGTGSGVIGVSLALECPGTEVLAVDMSSGALEVAQENARRLGADGISFLRSDLLEGLRGARVERFDVIVANLPYVDKGWGWNALELAYEPEEALYAGDGGLEVIKRLLGEAPEYIRDGGVLMLEADESQHVRVGEIAVDDGWVLERVLGLALVLRRG